MTAKPALLLALASACVTPADEGTLDQPIVGGQQASTTEFPTVVALQHGNGNWFCSGVLVHQDWVLTAASCFDSTAATQARIGDANLGDGTVSGLVVSVSAIHVHPSFDPGASTWRHDVALLALAQPVTDRTPTPIRRDATAIGSAITQAGFGVNTNNGNGGGVLRSLATTNVDCVGVGDGGITNANLLCFDASDGTGSCYGDGGAPAFVTGAGGRMVAGVGSGGTASSCTAGFDIYTALTAELAFIDGYVPQPPPANPPPNPPPPPSSGDPDPAGDPSTPRDPDGTGDGKRGPATAVGCDASGGASWFVVVALAGLVRRRRGRAALRRA